MICEVLRGGSLVTLLRPTGLVALGSEVCVCVLTLLSLGLKVPWRRIECTGLFGCPVEKKKNRATSAMEFEPPFGFGLSTMPSYCQTCSDPWSNEIHNSESFRVLLRCAKHLVHQCHEHSSVYENSKYSGVSFCTSCFTNKILHIMHDVMRRTIWEHARDEVNVITVDLVRDALVRARATTFVLCFPLVRGVVVLIWAKTHEGI